MLTQEQRELQELDALLRTILPEEYQDSYEQVQPVSMGSAGLRYAPDGSVAWDGIWGSFCDLAMAGGPPHKGKLLKPGTPDEIREQAQRYGAVVAEVIRGVHMVTDLPTEEAAYPGWVRVACSSPSMASWLARAIVMENVSARCDGASLYLPAGPDYRVEKEIKNVITSIAKTCHYYLDHMWAGQQRDIAELFERTEREFPLLQAGVVGIDVEAEAQREFRAQLSRDIPASTGFVCSDHDYENWLGVDCPSVRAAIWMMRALVIGNIASRREESTLFVPLNATLDPSGTRVTGALLRVKRLAIARGVV